MSVIGIFKTNGKEFTGEITILTIQAKAIRIVPAILLDIQNQNECCFLSERVVVDLLQRVEECPHGPCNSPPSRAADAMTPRSCPRRPH